MTEETGIGAMEWLRTRLRRHLSELVRLAAPVICSRTGILLLMTVDFATLGRAGAEETAFYALGGSIFLFLMVTGIGLMHGSMVVTTHRLGEGRDLEAGATWRRTVPLGIMLGGLLTLITFFSHEFFLMAGMEEVLAYEASRVSCLLGLGLIPTMIFVSSSLFLEALQRPIPVMIIIALANGINLGLDPLLVFGAGPIPALGADGAAIATSVARTFMGLATIAYVWWLRDRDRFGIRQAADQDLKGAWLARLWQGSREQRNYGYASGLAYGLESISFAMMQIYAGWMGATASAVFGLGMNLTALLFMGASGLATATAVRVGIAHGRRDLADRTLAGFTGFGVTLLLMGVFCATMYFETDWVAAFYTSDPVLLPVLLPAIVIIGFVMLGDGAQIVMSNANRAAADPWFATYLNFTSYLCVQIPLGYYLGIHLERGVLGLFEAILIASGVSVTLLMGRWIFLCRRGFARTA